VIVVTSHALERLAIRHHIKVSKKNKQYVKKELIRQVRLYQKKLKLSRETTLYVGDRFPVITIRDGANIIIKTVLTWDMYRQEKRRRQDTERKVAGPGRNSPLQAQHTKGEYRAS